MKEWMSLAQQNTPDFQARTALPGPSVDTGSRRRLQPRRRGASSKLLILFRFI
jgi:hypothetical protein